MDSSSAPQWEQERHAPGRARGTEDGGGAPGPSTVKGERNLLQKILTSFSCRRTLGRAMRRKAHRLSLGEAPILFFMSYYVGKTLKFVNVCLECPVFNALGAAVCRPQSVARRWARRCAKRCVAWPWQRRRSFFCVVLCWQNVKIYECLLGIPSFQYIGGGNVLPPISCRTLGRAARRKVHCLALAEAPMQIFCVVLCWQNVKICECFLKMRSFHCIGGGSVPPPPNCRTLGRAMHQKTHRLALVEAPILLSVSFHVNKTLKSVNVCLECLVFNALGATMCRPESLAGRWAGRRAERRVAWPWWRRQCKFFVPHRVGKMLKSVSVFLK